MSEPASVCGECGTQVPAEENRVFLDPQTYCLDCFDATCSRCDRSIVDDEDRVEKFGEYFCTECAERLCYDCGTYIENLETRNVIRGFIRCQECTWCVLDNRCCGCGTDISDSVEMVVVNNSHQFCADCKSELPADATVKEYPFEKDHTLDSNQDAPF